MSGRTNYISMKQACKQLDCTPQLIKELGAKGAITVWQPGGEHTRIWICLDKPGSAKSEEQEMTEALCG